MRKMKKTMLGVFLSVAMILTMLPATAFAAGGTITIDGKNGEYESLADAVSAAVAGDTIVIPAGNYDLSGQLTIDKAVSLKGAGAGETVLNGNILYGADGNENGDKTISVEGLTLKATSGNNHQGLCWNNWKELNGYVLNVKNCEFVGWEYAMGVNSQAKDCKLNVSNTTLTDVWCGVNVSEGAGNKIQNFAVDGNAKYEVQVFSGEYNAYYDSFESCRADSNRTNPTWDGNDSSEDGAPGSDWPAVAMIGTEYYKTLADALNAAVDNSEIKLINDVTLDSALPGTAISGKTLTINGNGHTLSFDQAQTAGAVFGNNTNPLYVNTNLTVKNLHIDNTGSNGGWASIVGYNANGSSVAYEGCTFNNLGAAVYVNPITQKPENGISVSLTDCDFTNTSFACGVDETSVGAYAEVVKVTLTDVTGVSEDESIVKDTVYAVVDGYKKSFGNDIQAAVEAADAGTVVTVTPGTYSGNVFFMGKSVTVQAQYPANKDGVQEQDNNKLSVFTGTFNTYGSAPDSFNGNQTVVIDGVALSGDGLKIGNMNYNSVGNLEVRHCTMRFGNNLSSTTGNSYAGMNYFVKVNGNAGAPYAAVIVEDNYISGAPAANVYPIQLWDVDKAVVRNNIMNLENAGDRQAIGVSKMAEDADVQIIGNEINGAGGGIYVTTWLSGGNGNTDFTGTIEVNDNRLTGAGKNGMYPIFLGYEEVANTPYGILKGVQKVSGNTNDGKYVDAVIGEKEGSEVNRVTVTIKDGDKIISSISGVDEVKVTLPAALEKDGYTFLGWSDGKTLYKAGDEITVKEDTVFTASWKKIENTADPQKPGEDSSDKTDGKTDASGTPVTGDDSVFEIWIALIVMAGAALAGVTVFNKKRKSEK